MVVYVAGYTGTEWEVTPVDSKILKFFCMSSETHRPRYCRHGGKGCGFYGNVINEEVIFTTEKAAWDWVHRNYAQAKKFTWDGVS